MKFEIRISLEAEEDIFESFVWYEKQKSGLGEIFLVEIENSIQKLAENPDFYPYWYRKKVKAYFVDPFPFLILFIKKEGFVDVISVFHSSRNPKIWKKRV